MWGRVLQNVRERVKKQKGNDSPGNGRLYWVSEDTSEKLRLETRRIYASIDGIDALCIDPDGFVGIFKQYGGSYNNLQAVIRDMYYLAQFRHEEAIEIGMMTTDGRPSGAGRDRGKAPRRLWRYHLFAGLKANPTDPALEQFAKDLYDGRLTEEIGLSLLFLPAGENSANPCEQEVTKFIAPLLLELRTWQEQDPLGAWRTDLMNRLRDVSALAPVAEDVLDLDVAAHQHLQDAISHVLQSPGDTESAGVRLRRIEDICIRRFTNLPKPLPFGTITLVHGPNGAGKTSLLDGIELAMTGQIHRIEKALKNLKTRGRRQTDNHETTYARLLTPMAKGSGNEDGDSSSYSSSHAENQFGAIAVEGAGDLKDLDHNLKPVRYKPQVDDDSTERRIAIRRSYYLAQGDLKTFVTADSADRYAWMTNVVNVPLEAVQEEVKSVHTSLRKASAGAWQSLTNRRLSAQLTNVYQRGLNRVKEIFESTAERAQKVGTELQHCSEQLAAEGQLPDWYLNATDKLPDVATIHRQCEDDCSTVSEVLALKRIGALEEERLEAALNRVVQNVPDMISLENSLIAVQSEIQSMLDSIADLVPEIDRRLPSTKPANGTPSDEPSPERVGQEISAEDRRVLEAKGQRIADNTTTAMRARRVAQTLSGLLRHIYDTVRQLAPLSEPDELTWSERDAELGTRYADFHAGITPVVEKLTAVGDHLSWLDKELQYWTDIERRLAQERKRWETTMQAWADLVADKPEPLLPEQANRLEQFLSRAGHADLVKNFVHDPDSPSTLKRVKKVVEAYQGVSHRLAQFAHAPTEEHDLEKLCQLVRTWYHADEDLSRCGAGVLFHCLDVADAKEKEIMSIVSLEMEKLLTTRVGRLWVELVGALTAHLWNYPLPRLKMEGTEQNRTMVIATDLGAAESLPADAVFNMGELHVLGLAWFLLSYILEGARHSDTMILDDPFQSLDDVNVSTVVRNLLEICRLGDVQQMTLALHQPGIVDYIRQEVAAPLQHDAVNGASSGSPHSSPSVAEWIVEPVDPNRSRVTPKIHLLRKNVRELPPMLDRVRLGDLGTRVNGVQSGMFRDP